MFILFVVLLLPLIGLFSLISGVGTIYFATSSAARAAAPATTSADAQTLMASTAHNIMGGGLGAFARVNPADESGMTLSVLQVKLSDQSVSAYTSPVDTSTYFYEYQVQSQYTVSPLFWIGSPIPFSFTVCANVEHPEGL
jgi:hypothetical protein